MRCAGILCFLWAGWCLGQTPALEDLKKMEGTWNATFLESGGKPPGEKIAQVKVKVVIKADQYLIFFNDKQVTQGTLKLNPANSPKSIDAMPTDGAYKDKVQAGIYLIEKDTMKIVFSEPGKPRPKEFKTTPETQETMILYQRAK